MSLQSLIEASGRSLPSVADAAGVSTMLLIRVDQERQPLPLFVADRVAELLGLPRWAVVEQVHQVVLDSAGPPSRLAAPHPPRYGDPIPALELRGPTVVDLGL